LAIQTRASGSFFWHCATSPKATFEPLFVVRPEPSCAVVFRSIFGSPLYDSLLTRTLRHSRHFAEQGAKGTLDHVVMVRIVWSFPCFQRLKGSGRLCLRSRAN
jgi:hypothetical protein